MDSFQDTNIEVRSRPFVVVDVIEVELDVLPFVEAYDHPNVEVFDPKVLEWADLNLKMRSKRIERKKIINFYVKIIISLPCYFYKKFPINSLKCCDLFYLPGDNSDTGVLEGVGLCPGGRKWEGEPLLEPVP